MNARLLGACCGIVAAVGCAASAASGAGAPGAALRQTPGYATASGAFGAVDPRLHAALNGPLADLDAIARLEAELGAAVLNEQLARAVADTALPRFVRGNALILLGERGAVEHWNAFVTGTTAEDPGVRSAAGVALQALLPEREDRALELLGRLLDDRDPWVAAKALEGLADHDVHRLRAYLAREPLPEIESSVRELIRLAESRGAPLAAAGSPDGVLVRELDDVSRFEFRPHTPGGTDRAAGPGSAGAGSAGAGRVGGESTGAESAVGEVVLVRSGRQPLVLGRDVEVVGNVLPVVVSPDQRFAAVEERGRIRIVDLEDGSERAVGAGGAPRPLPFSMAFIYLKPLERGTATDGADRTLRYEVIRVEFEDGASTSLGVLLARMPAGARHSPVHRMRVREYNGSFRLAGEGIETFTLPNPFLTP